MQLASWNARTEDARFIASEWGVGVGENCMHIMMEILDHASQGFNVHAAGAMAKLVQVVFNESTANSFIENS